MLGIILVDHGSREAASNQAFEELVARFGENSSYEIVEAAHMELVSPTIAEAFERATGRGAKEIIVQPFFLLPGRHWKEDIPALCEKAAAKHGVPWKMGEPLSVSEKVLDVIAERIESVR